MTYFARGLGYARGGGDLAKARAEVAKLDDALKKATAANQTFDAEQIDIQKRSVFGLDHVRRRQQGGSADRDAGGRRDAGQDREVRGVAGPDRARA